MELHFSGFKIRSYVEDDAERLTSYANNTKIAENLRDGFPSPYRVEDAYRFIGMSQVSSPNAHFAIATLEGVIGGIGFGRGEDVHRFTAELGYWLAEPFWNKGIMTQAVIKFVEYAFAEHELIRIYAEPYESNISSIRVLEKAGFKREGVLEANVYKRGKVVNQVLLAKVNREHKLFKD